MAPKPRDAMRSSGRIADWRRPRPSPARSARRRTWRSCLTSSSSVPARWWTPVRWWSGSSRATSSRWRPAPARRRVTSTKLGSRETLQGLASLVIGLRTARRSGDQATEEEAIDAALEQIQREIRNLRALIAQLRPAALDELGVEAAIDGLVDRVPSDGPSVAVKIDLDYEHGRHSTRPEPELEATIYRLVQEALNNAVVHARARTVRVEVVEFEGAVEIVVADDGGGFDPAGRSEGFRLVGMRE